MGEPDAFDDANFRRAISRALMTYNRKLTRRAHKGNTHARRNVMHRMIPKLYDTNSVKGRGILKHPIYNRLQEKESIRRRYNDNEVMDRRIDDNRDYIIDQQVAPNENVAPLMKNQNQVDVDKQGTLNQNKMLPNREELFELPITTEEQAGEIEARFPSLDVSGVIQPAELSATTRETYGLSSTTGSVSTSLTDILNNLLQYVTSFWSGQPLMDKNNSNVEKIPESSSWHEKSTAKQSKRTYPFRSALNNYTAPPPRRSILKSNTTPVVDGLFPLAESAIRSICRAIARTFSPGDRLQQGQVKAGLFVRAIDSRIITQMSRGTSTTTPATMTSNGVNGDDWFSRAFASSLSDENDDEWVNENDATKTRKRFASRVLATHPRRKRRRTDDRRKNYVTSFNLAPPPPPPPPSASQHVIDDVISDVPQESASRHPQVNDSEFYSASVCMSKRPSNPCQAAYYARPPQRVRFTQVHQR